MNESELQKRIRLQYAQLGCVLWRNNVGVAFTKDNVPIRYGLANESQKMNKSVKSSDLIGIQPVTITQEMVGLTLGQFMALECKRPGWQYSGTDREVAQAKFLEIVNAHGGHGSFITLPEGE